MMCDDSLIRERLEFLKNFTYDELNRLKTRIHSDDCGPVACLNHEKHDDVLTGGNKAGNSKCLSSKYLKHRKAVKRSVKNTAARRFKK